MNEDENQRIQEIERLLADVEREIYQNLAPFAGRSPDLLDALKRVRAAPLPEHLRDRLERLLVILRTVDDIRTSLQSR